MKQFLKSFVPPTSKDMVPEVNFGILSILPNPPAPNVSDVGVEVATESSAPLPAPDPSAVVAAAAWLNVAKVMVDLWKNEETRFNNINSRAIALLSATSLITTVLGYFSKNVLDTNPATRLSASQEDVAKWGTYVALALLAITAGLLVFGVLRPSGRVISGKNQLVGWGAQRPGFPLTTAQIDQTMAEEYGVIYVTLANRSHWKAYFMNLAYTVFAVAIVASLIPTYIVISQVPN
jgi:hypothetical protein